MSGLAAAPITLVGTENLSTAVLDATYSTVLRPAFPPSELVDADYVLGYYTDPRNAGSGIVAMQADEPVGVALGERHGPTGLMLLSYLAVRDSHRSLRIGATLLRHVTDAWSADPAGTGILAEVEDPQVHSASTHGDPRARLRFYDRAGARLLPITYFQPSLRPGLPRVHGLLLLSLVPAQGFIDSAALLSFVDDNLAAGEGPNAGGEDDADHRALRASVQRWGSRVPAQRIPTVTEVR